MLVRMLETRRGSGEEKVVRNSRRRFITLVPRYFGFFTYRPPSSDKPNPEKYGREKLFELLDGLNTEKIKHLLEGGQEAWGELKKSGIHPLRIKESLEEYYAYRLPKYEYDLEYNSQEERYFRRRVLAGIVMIALGVWGGLMLPHSMAHWVIKIAVYSFVGLFGLGMFVEWLRSKAAVKDNTSNCHGHKEKEIKANFSRTNEAPNQARYQAEQGAAKSGMIETSEGMKPFNPGHRAVAGGTPRPRPKDTVIPVTSCGEVLFPMDKGAELGRARWLDIEAAARADAQHAFDQADIQHWRGQEYQASRAEKEASYVADEHYRSLTERIGEDPASLVERQLSIPQEQFKAFTPDVRERVAQAAQDAIDEI